MIWMLLGGAVVIVLALREAYKCKSVWYVKSETLSNLQRYEDTRGVDQVCWPKGGPNA